MRKKAIVIGGGLGGLSAALTLSSKYDVLIIEKNDSLGGKMRSIDLDGYHFDFGPNTLTMPQYFWRVIEEFCEPKKMLPFQKINKPTTNRLNDLQLTFSTDINYMVEQLKAIDETSASNYPAFIKEITRLFKLSEETFLEQTFFNRKDYVNVQLSIGLLKAHPFKTLDEFIKSYFPHPFVQQLFNRFATYIGSSPYATPATFAMIAYFELVEGTYFIEGGATRIAEVFEILLKEQNVEIHTNEAIENIAIEDNEIVFCETASDRYEADLFICNTDYDYFQQILGRQSKKKEMSTSAYVELIALKKPVELAHHNLLYSEDYKKEFIALEAGEYAEQPTVYSCYPYASDVTNPPAIFVLINAPNAEANYDRQNKLVTEALEKWGIEEHNIVYRKILSPLFIKEQFNVVDGAIYGRASNTLKGSFFRPKNKDGGLKNLYYTGGTVHPGGGSPIVVKGGYHLAKRIIKACHK